jgi:hypothetical protein
MADLRFTLLPDGPSDRALIPILSWLLRTLTVNRAIQSELADFRRLRDPPRTLGERIATALELYPCDLLFVHRDSEGEEPAGRIREIENAVEAARIEEAVIVVCVVPIRMQEAWLLFDEMAIRRAAGNPNGGQILKLPPLKKIEALPDPKRVLYDLLRDASGLKGRRLSRFPVGKYAPQVSSFINDCEPLRGLSAFVSLEENLTYKLRDS